MLSIGEFSNICKVSTKTLRYYAEIGLLEPSVVNPENGYRCTSALFEVYVTDPSQVSDENDNITEVYYPVKKVSNN